MALSTGPIQRSHAVSIIRPRLIDTIYLCSKHKLNVLIYSNSKVTDNHQDKQFSKKKQTYR